MSCNDNYQTHKIIRKLIYEPSTIPYQLAKERSRLTFHLNKNFLRFVCLLHVAYFRTKANPTMPTHIQEECIIIRRVITGW